MSATLLDLHRFNSARTVCRAQPVVFQGGQFRTNWKEAYQGSLAEDSGCLSVITDKETDNLHDHRGVLRSSSRYSGGSHMEGKVGILKFINRLTAT